MIASSDSEGLAIVIPVWDLPDDLSALLRQIAEMRLFSEIIVSDDGSDQCCDPRKLGFTEEQMGGRLVYLKSDDRQGAGHARNRGLEAVTARHVLFFDADDELHDGLKEIWGRHRHTLPDFTIFRHIDTRVLTEEAREGSFLADELLWDLVLSDENEQLLDLRLRAHLSVISAYPWNKIYRTAFLRDNRVNCSETPVHNDIRLHWLSFLNAKRVLAVRNLGAIHVVGQRNHHLTTRSGKERFCLFDVLADLFTEIRQSSGNALLIRHFIHFVDNVCRWNLERIDSALTPEFARAICGTYLSIRPEEFRIYAAWQPDRALGIIDFILRERGGA